MILPDDDPQDTTAAEVLPGLDEEHDGNALADMLYEEAWDRMLATWRERVLP